MFYKVLNEESKDVGLLKDKKEPQIFESRHQYIYGRILKW